MNQIDHLGIAVKSLSDAKNFYEKLGLKPMPEETVETEKVRLSMVPVGESRIELLEPTSEDSPVARFLARRGGGVHHICFAVDDIEAALADLKGRGFRLLHDQPVPGADGKRVAFLHPDAGQGVLIELSQSAPGGVR